jgi:hypothetical protein
MRTTHALFVLVASTFAAVPAAAVDPAVSGRDPFSAYPDDVISCFGDTPITRVPVGSLKVMGFVVGVASPRALVLHPDGTTHLVRVGTPIGKNLGQVSAITPKGVVVQEEFRDGIGRRMAVSTVLAFR